MLLLFLRQSFNFPLEAVSKLLQAGTFDCESVDKLLNIPTSWFPPLESKGDNHWTPQPQGHVKNEWEEARREQGKTPELTAGRAIL